jgi:hypothetical protein
MQYKSAPSFGHPAAPVDDLTTDFRARLVQHQAETAERRRFDLAEQSSKLKTAEERIRIWERLHEVTLPRDPAHRLVDIIAANTGLTAADVREEQRRRVAPKAAAPAPAAAEAAAASDPAPAAATGTLNDPAGTGAARICAVAAKCGEKSTAVP